MKWINVKNKLPKEMENVLVAMKYSDNVEIAFITIYGDWYFPMSEMGEIVGDAYYSGEFKNEPEHCLEITHWMPLPKSPESFNLT